MEMHRNFQAGFKQHNSEMQVKASLLALLGMIIGMVILNQTIGIEPIASSLLFTLPFTCLIVAAQSPIEVLAFIERTSNHFIDTPTPDVKTILFKGIRFPLLAYPLAPLLAPLLVTNRVLKHHGLGKQITQTITFYWEQLIPISINGQRIELLMAALKKKNSYLHPDFRDRLKADPEFSERIFSVMFPLPGDLRSPLHKAPSLLMLARFHGLDESTLDFTNMKKLLNAFDLEILNQPEKESGDTLLLKTAQARNWPFVEHLIERGVDVNIRNREGKNIFAIASSQEGDAVFETILNKQIQLTLDDLAFFAKPNSDVIETQKRQILKFLENGGIEKLGSSDEKREYKKNLSRFFEEGGNHTQHLRFLFLKIEAETIITSVLKSLEPQKIGDITEILDKILQTLEKWDYIDCFSQEEQFYISRLCRAIAHDDLTAIHEIWGEFIHKDLQTRFDGTITGSPADLLTLFRRNEHRNIPRHTENLQIFRFLIEEQAEEKEGFLNTQILGDTPADSATGMFEPSLFKSLANAGADLEVKAEDGFTALQRAKSKISNSTWFSGFLKDQLASDFIIQRGLKAFPENREDLRNVIKHELKQDPDFPPNSITDAVIDEVTERSGDLHQNALYAGLFFMHNDRYQQRDEKETQTPRDGQMARLDITYALQTTLDMAGLRRTTARRPAG